MNAYVLKEQVRLERRLEHHVLTVPKAAELEWCVALTLLDTGLVKQVVSGDRRLTIAVDRKAQTGKRGAADAEHDTLRLCISPTELEVWLHFFLKAIRDGAPEVDHIDCELRGGHRMIDIVIAVEGAKAPMAGEDARRQLGL